MMIPLNLVPTVESLKRTTSRCPVCLVSIDAEIVRRDGAIVMLKRCETHGSFEVNLAGDSRFYHLAVGARESNAARCGGGCGCGPSTPAALVPESHDPGPIESPDPFEVLSTCIALIEIVDSCNLTCPTCYAASPWGVDEKVDCVPFERFRDRVGGVLQRKGFIDILQLSGGEPTIHPEFFQLLEWSLREKNIGYVLINTNAVRIATDRVFRERLGAMRRELGKFELYVQFDGPQEEGQRDLRGADLREIRRRAIDEAGALGVPSTLAMTVTPVTIAHLGETLRFGVERPHVRGITFQPMFSSGRTPASDSASGEHANGATRSLPIAPVRPRVISVGDVILNLVDQSQGLLTVDDFTPLPCGDPNCHTIGYLLRAKTGPIGMSRLIDVKSLQGFLRDRVDYRVEDLAKCGCESEPLGEIIKNLEISPEQPFRLFIKPFMDAWTFDQDRIDRCCTHVIRPDGSLDSFCRYYLNGGRNAAAAFDVNATAAR